MSTPKPSLSIMLVDDVRDSVQLLGTLLERVHGFKVRICTSGKEALEALAEFTPDVFVLDIVMPVMSGLDLARELRKMPAGQSALLIAISGVTRPTPIDTSLIAGFDRHLVKPVQADQLVAIIREWELSRTA